MVWWSEGRKRWTRKRMLKISKMCCARNELRKGRINKEFGCRSKVYFVDKLVEEEQLEFDLDLVEWQEEGQKGRLKRIWLVIFTVQCGERKKTSGTKYLGVKKQEKEVGRRQEVIGEGMRGKKKKRRIKGQLWRRQGRWFVERKTKHNKGKKEEKES